MGLVLGADEMIRGGLAGSVGRAGCISRGFAEPALVAEYARRLARLGFDRPELLHGFTVSDLAEDLAKSRLLLAYNMGLGKTRAAIAAAQAFGRGRYEPDVEQIRRRGEQ